MKNLLVLILIIFNPIFVVGQLTHYNDVSIVDDATITIDTKTIDVIFSNYYGFTVNNNIYILSYRKNDEVNWNHHRPIITKRDLLLYRKIGNNWVESSNIVQTDYANNKDTRNYTQYVTRGQSCGHVRILNSGSIVMLITNQHKYVSSITNNAVLSNYNSIAIFIPNNDDTYTCTYFEPENKNTIIPEICASDTLIASEINNIITLKVWNKQHCDINEKPDGYVNNKFPYKKKLITILNFKIINKNAEYYGQYKLIKK